MAYMTKKIFQIPEKNYGLNHIGSVHPGLSPPWPQSSRFNPPWPQSPWPQFPWPQSTWPQSPWNRHNNLVRQILDSSVDVDSKGFDSIKERNIFALIDKETRLFIKLKDNFLRMLTIMSKAVFKTR